MLIGICGPLGSGKSLAAKLLSAELGIPVCSFAGPLKEMLASIGVPRANLYGTPEQKAQPLKILCGKSAREAMQTLGTEWGRDMIGNDIWLNAWLAKDFHQGGKIADDVRFEGEARAILDRGGCVIRLVRPSVKRASAHSSEDVDALPYDFEVRNDKCPTVLKERLLAALNEWSACQKKANPARAAALRC